MAIDRRSFGDAFASVCFLCHQSLCFLRRCISCQHCGLWFMVQTSISARVMIRQETLRPEKQTFLLQAPKGKGLIQATPKRKRISKTLPICFKHPWIFSTTHSLCFPHTLSTEKRGSFDAPPPTCEHFRWALRRAKGRNSGRGFPIAVWRGQVNQFESKSRSWLTITELKRKQMFKDHWAA